jgi:Flp pilus assembly secretin CpaC
MFGRCEIRQLRSARCGHASGQMAEDRGAGDVAWRQQSAEFLHAGQDAPSLSVIASPRMVLFSGQRANVLVSTSRRYTSGYAAVAATGREVRYDPILAVAETGMLLDVEATVSADRKAVTLSLHPQVSALLSMKQLPWIGRPAGSNLKVQEPQVRSTELQTTVSIPDGRTLLLGGLEDPRVPGAAAATRPDHPLRSLFLLIKPSLIVPQPGSKPAE